MEIMIIHLIKISLCFKLTLFVIILYSMQTVLDQYIIIYLYIIIYHIVFLLYKFNLRLIVSAQVLCSVINLLNCTCFKVL